MITKKGHLLVGPARIGAHCSERLSIKVPRIFRPISWRLVSSQSFLDSRVFRLCSLKIDDRQLLDLSAQVNGISFGAFEGGVEIVACPSVMKGQELTFVVQSRAMVEDIVEIVVCGYELDESDEPR